MNFLKTLTRYLSLSKLQSQPNNLYHHHLQHRSITKVRLKWVKNKSLDHIIDIETDLKAGVLLKDAIKQSPTGFITIKTVANWQKFLGLTIPVLRFMRRYPTLFKEFPHTRYASLPCFKLTDTAMFLDQQEQNVYETHELECIERLCKVLMMVKSRDGLPLKYVYPLKWDLGLPFEFHKTLVEKYPEHLRVVKTKNGVLSLRLEQWRDELAVSALQKRYESAEFKRGREALSFPMNFPKGYGREKKVQSWMDCFQKLPYISPYEDSSKIDPNSDLMEKRVVAVLHELLSLTIHKKTKRNYLTCLIDELNLPDKFTRVFTRYPGIFYLSMKCKTTTITLKEAYERGKLVDPHPLSRVRDKFYYVMRAGIMYRGKKVDFIPDKDFLVNYKENGSEQEESEEEEEVDMEMWSESDDE